MGVFLSFPYWVSTRVCANDATALARYLGEYPDEVFLTTLADTKSVPNAMKAWRLSGRERPMVISITAEEIVASDGWQKEGVSVDCAYVLRNKISLEGRSEHYVRLEARTDGALHMAPYFNVLFSGCYRDEKNEPWCFRPNEIQIGETAHHGELQMDLVALPRENVVRLDDSNTLLLFRRTSAGGWAVNETEPTAEQTTLDWAHPRHVLTPAPATKATGTP